MKNKKRKKNVEALNATRLDNLGQATQKVLENQRKNIHFAEQDPCSGKYHITFLGSFFTSVLLFTVVQIMGIWQLQMLVSYLI